jgi:hypothetical protein
MHVYRLVIEYWPGELYRPIRRDVHVLAGDGAEVFEALDAFLGDSKYRIHGFVRLADRPRVLIGVGA